MEELYALGQNLPRITREIGRLLDQREPTQRLLDALALKIMMLCNFRIGNPKNRDKYQTYGVVTLTADHVKFLLNGDIEICFVGKKQQTNRCCIKDKQIIWWIKYLLQHHKSTHRRSRTGSRTSRTGSRTSRTGSRTSRSSRSRNGAIDDEQLLSYDGYKVSPESVNHFLQDFDPEITAKVWRTWFTNAMFVEELKSTDVPETPTERREQIRDVIEKLAEKMHHTASINRQSYLIKDLPKIYVEAPDTWQKLSSATRDGTEFLMTFLDYHISNPLQSH
jgi:DNA topoisomerase IB